MSQSRWDRFWTWRWNNWPWAHFSEWQGFRSYRNDPIAARKWLSPKEAERMIAKGPTRKERRRREREGF